MEHPHSQSRALSKQLLLPAAAIAPVPCPMPPWSAKRVQRLPLWMENSHPQWWHGPLRRMPMLSVSYRLAVRPPVVRPTTNQKRPSQPRLRHPCRFAVPTIVPNTRPRPNKTTRRNRAWQKSIYTHVATTYPHPKERDFYSRGGVSAWEQQQEKGEQLNKIIYSGRSIDRSMPKRGPGASVEL